MRSLVEATRSEKWDQISELSQVFQAIHNLDYICTARPEGVPAGPLNYQATQFMPDVPKVTNIDQPSKSAQLAKGQLKVIERYLMDYEKVIKQFVASQAESQGYALPPSALRRVYEESDEDDD